MAKNEVLHIRVNEDVKRNAEETLGTLGLSISEAVNILLHQVSLVGGLPFDVKIPSAPRSVIARDKDELYEMLDIGSSQIKSGKVIDADIFMTKLREEHGFSE